jgi:hypothetical protein
MPATSGRTCSLATLRTMSRSISCSSLNFTLFP